MWERGGEPLLFAISFTAKPGREGALESILCDPGLVRRTAERMGASLDAVFVQGNRFTQVYDIPDADQRDVRARVLAAQDTPELRDMLKAAAPMLDDPFDPDDPTSVAAFIQRHKLKLIAAARRAPSAKPSSVTPPIGAAPR